MSTDAETPLAQLLQTAAYNGDVITVRRLMQEAVDPNSCDRWGRTALTLASQEGHLDVVEILIAAKASVDPWDEYSIFDTPLIAAAENGYLGIVQTLISAGANPRHHGGPSLTIAEHYARSNGHREISDYLSKLK
jgi:ankyrin repeat protein